MRTNLARLALALSPVFLWLLAFILLPWSGPGFALLMLAAIALWFTLALVVRCPNCRKPLYLRERKGGLFGSYSLPTFERTCSRCGERQVP
jgi:hypothetical protein